MASYWTSWQMWLLKKKVEVDISVMPNCMEIKIEPWKPYEMKCPYGKDDKDV